MLPNPIIPRHISVYAFLAETSRGIVSFTAVIAAAVLLAPAGALAQSVPLPCLPGSTGPIAGDPTPYEGGLCALGVSVRSGRPYSLMLSSDGLVVVGNRPEGFGEHAFRWAQGVVSDLGGLAADPDQVRTVAKGINGDGSVVVGSYFNGTTHRAFRWDSGVVQEIEALGENLPFYSSQANAVSVDGSVVVGTAYNGEVGRAFRWVDGVMEDLGSILEGRSDRYGIALLVSADGSVVAGDTENDYVGRAFRWEGGRMVDLGSLGENTEYHFSNVRDMSSDGSVIVGSADSWNRTSRAFRWSDGVMQDLGTLGQNLSYYTSEAVAVSVDGSVVAGTAYGDNGFRAFRWFDGIMYDLGTLDSAPADFQESEAFAMSADGSVVVGRATKDDAVRPFRWVDGVMQDLGTLGGDPKFTFGEATTVSADGSIVAGYMYVDEVPRAFIWRTQMQDFAQLVASFPVVAADTEIGIVQHQGHMTQIAGETCMAETGRGCLRTGLAHSSTGATTDVSGSVSISTLSYGHGVTDRVTFGFTLAFGATELRANGFDMGTGVSGAVWGSYSQGGTDHTGWQGEVAVGYGKSSGQITRGRGLEDVLLSTGEAELSTTLARAELGYGHRRGAWLLTPHLGISQLRTARNAYGEAGGDFSASFEALSVTQTTLDLGLDAETPVGERARLTLAAGVTHDLRADRVVLRGVSDLPGMESFSVGGTLERRGTRGYLSAGYAHEIGNGATLSGILGVAQPVYGNKPDARMGLNMAMRF